MSGMPSLTILSKEQKFNGNNLLQWNTNITQLLGSKGLSGYIDRKIQKPDLAPTPLPSETSTMHSTTTPTSTMQSTTTPIYLTTPSLHEWIFVTNLRGAISLLTVPM